LIRQYGERVTHAPEEERHPTELDDANAARTPTDESSAPNPEPVTSLDKDKTNSPGMSPSTTRPWYQHYLREQQAKIQHHNENLMAIQPIEDALYIYLNKIAKILDHPMMSLGDFLEIRRIPRLPPDTPAEEIIRARGRLVCSFVDLPACPSYDDAIDLAAGDLALVSFINPSSKQQLQFNASLPPSPRRQRTRERQFNNDVLS
jgi:hypothetical protein